MGTGYLLLYYKRSQPTGLKQQILIISYIYRLQIWVQFS